MSKWALGTFSSTLWMVMAVSCLVISWSQPASAPDWVVRAWALGGFLSGQAGFLVMLLTPEPEDAPQSHEKAPTSEFEAI